MNPEQWANQKSAKKEKFSWLLITYKKRPDLSAGGVGVSVYLQLTAL